MVVHVKALAELNLTGVCWWRGGGKSQRSKKGIYQTFQCLRAECQEKILQLGEARVRLYYSMHNTKQI